MLQDKLHLFVARFTVPLDWQTSGRRCAHFHSLLSVSAPCYPYLELIKANRKGNKSKQGFEFTPGNRSRSRSLRHKRQRTNRQCQDRLKSWIQVHGFHITVKRVTQWRQRRPGEWQKSTTIMEKSLGTLLRFWGVFQFTQVQPLPSPHKQCWTCVSWIFSEFQLCIGWREGVELQENFENDALF